MLFHSLCALNPETNPIKSIGINEAVVTPATRLSIDERIYGFTRLSTEKAVDYSIKTMTAERSETLFSGYSGRLGSLLAVG